MTSRPPRDLRPDLPVIVVEGGDEEAALVRGLGVPKGSVFNAQGREKVVGFTKELMRRPDAHSVPAWAVILDATDDPANSLAIARRALAPKGDIEGPGWTSGPPMLGVHLLPEAGAGGLESLLTAIARRVDPARSACVDGLFTCAGQPAGTTEARAKAWIAAWTATRDPKVRPVPHLEPLLAAAPELEALRRFLARAGSV